MQVWINRKKYNKYGKDVGEETKYKIVKEVEIKSDVILISYLSKDGQSMIYEVLKNTNEIKIIGD